MKDKYIKLLMSASRTQKHELIEECLDYYDVFGMIELTAGQLEEFCYMKGLIV